MTVKLPQGGRTRSKHLKPGMTERPTHMGTSCTEERMGEAVGGSTAVWYLDGKPGVSHLPRQSQGSDSGPSLKAVVRRHLGGTNMVRGHRS